jgi:hypothetical protein
LGSSENTSWSEIEKGVSRVINYVSPSEIRQKLRTPRGVKEVEPPEGISEQRVLLEQIMLDDGSTYEGEWAVSQEDPTRKIREGYGIQLWMDGSIYEGWFCKDRAAGRGRLIHSDGYIYEGEWQNDKAEGRGTY